MKAGHLAALLKALKRLFRSEKLDFGLIRDLSQPFETPSAKIPLIVRPMEAADLVKIKAVKDPELLARMRWISEGIGTCYVALSPDNDPAYFQFLVGANENDRLEYYFKDAFPKLGSDEALIEGAFMFEDFRGLWIMPNAMSQIAQKAEKLKATKVVTFVEEDNIPALKGCKRAGFVPYLTGQEKWRLFFKKTSFVSLQSGTPYSFDIA